MTAGHPQAAVPPQVVVIGIGNPQRGDDAVGHVVVGRLATMLGVQPQVRLQLESGEGARLMAAWSGAETALLIDAMLSGVAPGTIQRLDAVHQPVAAAQWRCSTHTFGVAEAIELARVLQELPAHLIVYGIEAASCASGAPLSAAVERAVPEVLTRLRQDIASFAAAIA